MVLIGFIGKYRTNTDASLLVVILIRSAISQNVFKITPFLKFNIITDLVY